jgi:hypothetical protein
MQCLAPLGSRLPLSNKQLSLLSMALGSQSCPTKIRCSSAATFKSVRGSTSHASCDHCNISWHVLTTPAANHCQVGCQQHRIFPLG